MFFLDHNWTEIDYNEVFLKDNPNVTKLSKYNFPVIPNLKILFEALCLQQSDLKMLFYSRNREQFLYREYKLPKKSGGYRIIEVPNPKLMSIQKAINRMILPKFTISKYCCGFVKHKSIVDNAMHHLGAKTLLKFDIENFFGSIGYFEVFSQFKFWGYGDKVAKVLASLCVDHRMVLPQGAPTSPSLSNAILMKKDFRIEKFCSKMNEPENDFQLRYSRYADDITISSTRHLSKSECGYIQRKIRDIIEDHSDTAAFNGLNLKLNSKKTRVFNSGDRMEVTGLVVGEKISVSKSKIRELDNAIKYITRYGMQGHLEHIKCEKSNYVGHLYGLASFVNMVDSEKGQYYFEKLDEVLGGNNSD